MNLRTMKESRMNKLMVVALMIAMFVCGSVMPALAGGMDMSGVDTVMDTVIQILSTAALYVGVVISLWGVFQIILAMRREDSEAISKQIMTVVVGAVLIGFGATADTLMSTFMGGGGGGGGGGPVGP